MATHPALPDSVLREAYEAANEKHFHLARLFYRLLLGREWRYCLLGFSYVKCIDDIVDIDPRPERALTLLDAQLDLMKRVYRGQPPDSVAPHQLPHPTRFGYYLFAWDRVKGARLEPILTDIMDTMSFDVRRKGKALDGATLAEHAVKVGATSIRFLAHFVDRDTELTDSFLRLSSLAYLKADNLIDLEDDLGDRIINIPAEDLEKYGISLEGVPLETPALEKWVDAEAERVGDWFEQARREASRLDGWKMRFLARTYLWRKRRAFERFLERRSD